MLIRKLESKDHLEIKQMLKLEGAQQEYGKAINAHSYVLEDKEDMIGFFGFAMEHGYPSLKSFCLKREHRGLRNANLLMNGYINLVKAIGFQKMIFTSTKESFNKLLEWKFKITPYAKIDNVWFYFKEV